MDSELYKQSIQYEKLTQIVYQQILKKEGVNTVEVEHNINLIGRSGVEHQIDILWRFKQAGIEHKVLIECKNYASAISLEKVRNFFAVMHDIGNCVGLMVTKSGYQSGTVQFAKFYGIELKLLNKPNDNDWKGRIKDIETIPTMKFIVNTPEQPIKLELYIEPI
ncbi:restriction endonuclease [Anabaena sp. WFMT]|uniref:restriction endonuclease n=1 Tax=Anabaena sp. WFMT TaxID=3449730 RepID=UPI003F25D1FE